MIAMERKVGSRYRLLIYLVVIVPYLVYLCLHNYFFTFYTVDYLNGRLDPDLEQTVGWLLVLAFLFNMYFMAIEGRQLIVNGIR